MSDSISTTLTKCLESFDELIRRAKQPDYRYKEETSSDAWTDELGRLREWASYVGAQETGQSSIESRVGNASSNRLRAANNTILEFLRKID